MSYCVNCGVKLKNSEKKCPLCHTKVINPNQKNKEPEFNYSSKFELYDRINYKYVIKLILLLLLSISLIIFFFDFITSRALSWSIYVVTIIFYLTCHLQYLFGKNIYKNHCIEMLGTNIFFLIIAALNNGLQWYVYFVIPFTVIILIFLLLSTYLFKKRKIHILKKISICSLYISGMFIALETLIDLYLVNKINYHWSMYASLPLIIFSVIIFVISCDEKLIDEIKQRIFI